MVLKSRLDELIYPGFSPGVIRVSGMALPNQFPFKIQNSKS